jgi:hypothetical protein
MKDLIVVKSVNKCPQCSEDMLSVAFLNDKFEGDLICFNKECNFRHTYYWKRDQFGKIIKVTDKESIMVETIYEKDKTTTIEWVPGFEPNITVETEEFTEFIQKLENNGLDMLSEFDLTPGSEPF